MRKKVTKAIFPVAGLGTRFLPATKSVPKEIMTLVDRPLIQYAIDEARDAGITEFIFVTSRGKSALEDYFDRAPELEASLIAKNKTELLNIYNETCMDSGAIAYVRQNQALGLGHAVWCARNLIGDEPFAVLLPDDVIAAEKPCLQQMVEAYDKVGGNIVAVDPVPMERVSSYGVIAPVERDGRLIRMSGMVEKPPVESAPSNLAITGRYILQPEVFGLLADQGKGAGGEIQLTDSMARLMETQDFFAYEFEGLPYDCGSKLGYFEAVLAHALDNAETSAGARELIKKAVAAL